MYGVKITYSWNDQEPVAIFYETAEKAFRAACHLAAEEAYVQNEDMLPEGNVVVTFDAGQYAIDLEYRSYMTGMTGYCYYRVFEFCEACGLVTVSELEGSPTSMPGILSIVGEDGHQAKIECCANLITREILDIPQEIIATMNDSHITFAYIDVDGSIRAIPAVHKSRSNEKPYVLTYKVWVGKPTV